MLTWAGPVYEATRVGWIRSRNEQELGIPDIQFQSNNIGLPWFSLDCPKSTRLVCWLSHHRPLFHMLYLATRIYHSEHALECDKDISHILLTKLIVKVYLKTCNGAGAELEKKIPWCMLKLEAFAC
jgi:hypothetical protein